jgi:hypothetical protein
MLAKGMSHKAFLLQLAMQFQLQSHVIQNAVGEKFEQGLHSHVPHAFFTYDF